MADALPPRGIPADGLNDAASKSLRLLTESLLRGMREYSPLRVGLSPAEQAAHRARADEAKRKREAGAQASFDAAHADWEATRSLLVDNRPALAALGEHEPQCGYLAAECSECRDSDGYEGVDAVVWPCGTYTAIRDAVG